MKYFKHILWQSLFTFLFQFIRHAIKCFCYTASNASQCIAITPQGYSSSYHVLKTGAFQESRYCFMYSLLTAFNMIVIAMPIPNSASRVSSTIMTGVLLTLLNLLRRVQLQNKQRISCATLRPAWLKPSMPMLAMLASSSKENLLRRSMHPSLFPDCFQNPSKTIMS